MESEIDNREDLRDLPTVTIDPDYAHDHDDAISVVKEGDSYRSFVHIADVSHYIEPDSAIDEEAAERGVTFYLGDETQHMLPRRVAQEICSLKPDTDRLAHTVEMEMDEAGEILDYDIYKSVIKSDAHLTYTHADAIIDSSDEILQRYDEMDIEHESAEDFQKFTEALAELDPLTQNIREERWDQSFITDPRQNDSSRIIEEMMISANLAVGDYLSDEFGIYRTHDNPEPGWTVEVQNDLESLPSVHYVPDEVHSQPKKTLNDLFDEVISPRDIEAAEEAVMPKLPRARYTVEDGDAQHFGLGMENYAHFTSPIRRFTDLVLHRMVSGGNDYSHSELSEIAEKVSEQQEAADKAALAYHDANT